MQFGYLRETKEIAQKAGVSSVMKIPRTGLDEYLQVIFPEVNDWVHDKCIPNSGYKFRPDYRSEQLKMIVEFNGLPHYQKPDVILKDRQKTIIYKELGYKPIMIPFFIQLTNKAVKTLFDVDIEQELFPENIASLCSKDLCTPAYLCPLGIEQMAIDFKKFPEQYELNMQEMKKEELILTRWDLLEEIYNSLK